MIEKTVEPANGRIPVIAETGTNATGDEAIVMMKLLRDSGVHLNIGFILGLGVIDCASKFI
ncbi:hypothetical protein BKK54_07470 [Rodentibacter genomosp. 1]|uniref:Uncharacterized protein n=1 Tax=Rodentibacter genomosp. 1 TaxID=1908264 RepID=A0A1V3J4F0_9PAST|nr:hypothetical protein BKK54_07470 [Rodentibacter genomosp. 1]